MLISKNGQIEETISGGLIADEGTVRNAPKRGKKKVDPWDGRWKEEKDFYFPKLGESSLDFLTILMEEGP